ncbi:sulfatase family protein [Vagococcus elongatus]|uniref:Sulfatase n=1 Tax=Vagococcus elongatus TaxID=180344 RepID=A0A430B4A9_9ENTE|nr:sulfatase [Vagococcus elongatus]RSU15143.1 sulfatase [Vagococcus elongatus]
MKPNIIFMISHDSGRMFSNYGYKVETPNFDYLAQQSVQFNNYFCSAPQCSPSRGSILTGKYPHNNGLMGLAHLGFAINSKTETLPKILTKNGYETTLVGLSHETINTPPKIEDRIFSSTTELGYENYIAVDGDRASKVATSVINYLSARDSQRPFYLNAGFFETHRDFDEYQPYADKRSEVKPFDFLKDTPKVRKDVGLFNGSLKVLDAAVGRIVNFIENSQYKNDTIIIFTTDHGVAFPGAKGTLKNSGLGTALLIGMPNSSQKNVQKDALLCNVDLMPTLLELTGITAPKDIDGKSFASLLKSDIDEGREEFFTELTWHDRYQPMRGIRTRKYSYVRNFADGPKIYVTVDAHLSLSGEEMRDECYIPNEPEELYDLQKDPLEKNNIINDENYFDIAEKLRKKVNTWMIETEDPLLKGDIKGVGSSRWEKEISEGRAYPGRKIFNESLNS